MFTTNKRITRAPERADILKRARTVSTATTEESQRPHVIDLDDEPTLAERIQYSVLTGNKTALKEQIESADDSLKLGMKNRDGNSLLHLAVIHDQPEILAFLCDFSWHRKMNANLIDRESRTALHLAVLMGRLRCVVELLNYRDIEINWFCKKERLRPLGRAVMAGYPEIADLLLNDSRTVVFPEEEAMFAAWDLEDAFVALKPKLALRITRCYKTLPWNIAASRLRLFEGTSSQPKPLPVDELDNVELIPPSMLSMLPVPDAQPVEEKSDYCFKIADQIFDDLLSMQEVMPARLNQFDPADLEQALQGDPDTLAHLDKYPGYQLTHWFQGNQNPRWHRIALSLAHFRYMEEHPGPEILLTECQENDILNNPVQTLKNYDTNDYKRILGWLRWVCDTPEAFLYHEKYQTMRTIISNYKGCRDLQYSMRNQYSFLSVLTQPPVPRIGVPLLSSSLFPGPEDQDTDQLTLSNRRGIYR